MRFNIKEKCQKQASSSYNQMNSNHLVVVETKSRIQAQIVQHIDYKHIVDKYPVPLTKLKYKRAQIYEQERQETGSEEEGRQMIVDKLGEEDADAGCGRRNGADSREAGMAREMRWIHGRPGDRGRRGGGALL